MDPSYSQAHRTLGLVLVAMGRHEEAREEMRRARELEPLYPMQLALSAYERLLARDYPSALEFALQATDVGPSFWIGYFQLAAVYEQLGQQRAGAQGSGESRDFDRQQQESVASGIHPGEIGAPESGRGRAAHLEKRTARERYVPPYAMALVYAGLGQRDSAFKWLEDAYKVRDVHLVFLVAGDPKWDVLREDPRFRALVERCDFMRTAKTVGHAAR